MKKKITAFILGISLLANTSPIAASIVIDEIEFNFLTKETVKNGGSFVGISAGIALLYQGTLKAANAFLGDGKQATKMEAAFVFGSGLLTLTASLYTLIRRTQIQTIADNSTS